jgi:hypothetical protein
VPSARAARCHIDCPSVRHPTNARHTRPHQNPLPANFQCWNVLRIRTSVRPVPQRHHIIPPYRKIIKRRRIPMPSRHVQLLVPHDMRRSEHLHAPLTLRPLDQRHLQLDRLPLLKLARRQEENSARTDVAGHQCHWIRFGNVIDADQPQRKRQRGARIETPLVCDANGVSGNARKLVRSRLAVRGNNTNR